MLGKREFYEERPKCRLHDHELKGTRLLMFILDGNTVSPLSLFKNPMILLAVFALAMTFGMPYLIDNSMFLRVDTTQACSIWC